MRTLVIASQKGGVGKTTIAGHLGVMAESQGAGPVALIDTDPQGSLSSWWNERQAEAPGFRICGHHQLARTPEAARKGWREAGDHRYAAGSHRHHSPGSGRGRPGGPAAAFAFLNNGRWQECLAAAIAAGCGKLVQLLLRRLHLNHLVIIAVAATTACLVYMLSAQLLQHLLPTAENPLHEAAFTSAILFLVPGFPLLTAALDLARFDFTSGVSRLLYASLITRTASIAVLLLVLNSSCLRHPPVMG